MTEKSRRQVADSWPIKHKTWKPAIIKLSQSSLWWTQQYLTSLQFVYDINTRRAYLSTSHIAWIAKLVTISSDKSIRHHLVKKDFCSGNEDRRSVDVTNPRATVIKIWLYHQRLYLEPPVILRPLTCFSNYIFQTYEWSGFPAIIENI